LTSFLKDILLLILIIVIFINRNHIESRIKPWPADIFLFASIILVSLLQNHVMQHLPFVDCLPYKVGNNIAEQMKVPKGAAADSFAITFKYKKNGKEIEFDQNNFPADFDSTYEYIDRYDKLIKKGMPYRKL